MTFDVMIKVHFSKWFVRSPSTGVPFHTFQSSYCRLVLAVSKERFLAKNKFHLPLVIAHKDDVAIQHWSRKECVHSKTVSIQKDSLAASSSKLYGWENDLRRLLAILAGIPYQRNFVVYTHVTLPTASFDRLIILCSKLVSNMIVAPRIGLEKFAI